MITKPIQFARKLSDLVKSLATEVAFKDTTAPEIAASIVAFQVGSRIPYSIIAHLRHQPRVFLFRNTLRRHYRHYR